MKTMFGGVDSSVLSPASESIWLGYLGRKPNNNNNSWKKVYNKTGNKLGRSDYTRQAKSF